MIADRLQFRRLSAQTARLERSAWPEVDQRLAHPNSCFSKAERLARARTKNGGMLFAPRRLSFSMRQAAALYGQELCRLLGAYRAISHSRDHLVQEFRAYVAGNVNAVHVGNS